MKRYVLRQTRRGYVIVDTSINVEIAVAIDAVYGSLIVDALNRG